MDFFTRRCIGAHGLHLEKILHVAQNVRDIAITRAFVPPGIRSRPGLCHDDHMSATGGPTTPRVTRVMGVYDADGSLVGELRYLWRRTFAGEHCALCDITHGSLRRRPQWDRSASAFSDRRGVDIVLFHLDDAPVSITALPHYAAPAVFFETSDGAAERVMGPEDLAACGHSPEALFAALDRELDRRS